MEGGQNRCGAELAADVPRMRRRYAPSRWPEVSGTAYQQIDALHYVQKHFILAVPDASFAPCDASLACGRRCAAMFGGRGGGAGHSPMQIDASPSRSLPTAAPRGVLEGGKGGGGGC